MRPILETSDKGTANGQMAMWRVTISLVAPDPQRVESLVRRRRNLWCNAIPNIPAEILPRSTGLFLHRRERDDIRIERLTG